MHRTSKRPRLPFRHDRKVPLLAPTSSHHASASEPREGDRLGTRAIGSRLPSVEVAKRRFPYGRRRVGICKVLILRGGLDTLILGKIGEMGDLLTKMRDG